MVRPDPVGLGRQSVRPGLDRRPGPDLYSDLDRRPGPDRRTGPRYLVVQAVPAVRVVQALPLESRCTRQ